MRKMLDAYKDIKTIRKIIRIQLDKIEALKSKLGKIKRKSDYRFFDEQLSSEEKTAWIKAVKL